jgi:valyl-tRNA synthetase
MQPHLAPAIDKATRKQFPKGIEPHGTDALRFTFAALATQSRDIRFELGRVAGYRNFCNKLWNGARFVLMMTETEGDVRKAASAAADALAPGLAERWIRSRFRRMLEDVEQAFADYRFDFAATALYEFTWYEFCDWYLELAKPVLQSEATSPAQRAATQRTLLEILEALLRALHPVMPFITEEIWQRVAPVAGVSGESVMVAPWPERNDFELDEPAEAQIAWIKGFVLGLRQIRGEMDISPARRLPVLLENASAADREFVTAQTAFIERLAGLESIRFMEAGGTAPPSATALVGAMKVLVPMAGLIDATAESERLGKRIAKAQQELAKARAKLGNASFVSNAPPEVVAQENARVADFERSIATLGEQLARVRLLL